MAYERERVGRITFGPGTDGAGGPRDQERLSPGLEPVEPLVPECDYCGGKCKYGNPFKQLPTGRMVPAARFQEELAKLRAANDNAPPPPPRDPWEPLDRLDDYWRGLEQQGVTPIDALYKAFEALGDELADWTRRAKAVLHVRDRGENFDDIMRAHLKKLQAQRGGQAEASPQR